MRNGKVSEEPGAISISVSNHPSKWAPGNTSAGLLAITAPTTQLACQFAGHCDDQFSGAAFDHEERQGRILDGYGQQAFVGGQERSLD